MRKHFGGIRAVDGLSATVEEGTLVGLIGPNGSGKSTLFNVISGVYKPDGGRVLFRDERIDGLDPDEIFARGVVRSFQNPRLFEGMTVLENALLPPRDQIGERVSNAPFPDRWSEQEVSLAEEALASLSRHQLDGVRMNWATDVSGGQMKLLEVARAMMGEPRLLLLDE
ncbi:MAG: ATP-binding cassette domain-containing protein, partial [Thermoplasmata archaeon]|nr:ATP-binding cassette domain-containing protein [Thermoplasmata archaeon]